MALNKEPLGQNRFMENSAFLITHATSSFTAWDMLGAPKQFTIYSKDINQTKILCGGETGSDRTVVPTKSDSDVISSLQLFSKTLTCTIHLSIRESRDHLCINPILWMRI